MTLPTELATLASSSPIANALLSIYPALVEENIRWMTRHWESLLNKRGADLASYEYHTHRLYPIEKLVLYPSSAERYEDRELVTSFCSQVAEFVKVKTPKPVSPEVYAYKFDANNLEKNARRTAQHDALMWYRKMERKLAGATNVVRQNDDIYNLLITCEYGNAKIEIRQSVVTKWAPRKRTLYNQFPARIYVNGKFCPESKLAERVAQVQHA